MKKLFSISEKESKYFDDKHECIELVSCRFDGTNCMAQRALINKKMLTLRRLWLNKNYEHSIAELKSAFYNTDELDQSTCLQCAKLFRSTITRSLENIHEDLHKMTTGFFNIQHYQSHYELATNVLKEFKEVS
ncbi:MAG: hypothetical protein Q7W54_12665 [Bacteroidota bacterium]|nr:hypothetical protein [Bacteroidota bacterium]